MKTTLTSILMILLLLTCSMSEARVLRIVAAENFYGDIAQQIGGSHVVVKSIMSSPTQDPHLFSINPSIAKAIADADIVIYNGINYDPWMEKLLKLEHSGSQIILVSDLMHKKSGDNPHIWYDPSTMPTFAAYLTQVLIKLDPTNQKDFNSQLNNFNKKYQNLNRYIAELKGKFHNVPVIATEPVFNEMAKALGLQMFGLEFQIAVMNDIAPSAGQIQNFENLLEKRAVSVLIYNRQVHDPVTEHMQAIAKQQQIPTLGVSELEPINKDYIAWMQDELTQLELALRKKNSVSADH